ncbi:MAG TPA: FliA/WhiG family RNA polymerase sigma factor [Bryobacteraceae bacterium]|nr:FliA/WhiG family RNA polymerase sigma factor [Bryobacteraceae bacterium]
MKLETINCNDNAAGTAFNRDEAILEHLPQVRLIARRICDRLPGHVNMEDLVSAGTVGLIAAIDKYDATQGVKLRTYAEYKIRGAILDSLRELDWAPRRQRRRARQLQEAVAQVEQKAQGKASEEDVAVELGISVDEVREWMGESQWLQSTTVSTTPERNGSDMIREIPAMGDSLPSDAMEQSELRAMLARALERMPRNERTVLSLYYHESMTLREIARVMEVHESRVSQLKLQALARLRIVVEKQWPMRGGVVKSSVRPGSSAAARA